MNEKRKRRVVGLRECRRFNLPTNGDGCYNSCLPFFQGGGELPVCLYFTWVKVLFFYFGIF